MTLDRIVGGVGQFVERFSAFVELYPIAVVGAAIVVIAAIVCGAEWWMVRRDRREERQRVDLRRREFRQTQGWDTSRRSLEKANGRDLQR